MKKMAFALLITMVLCVSACGNSNGGKPATKGQASDSGQELAVKTAAEKTAAKKSGVVKARPTGTFYSMQTAVDAGSGAAIADMLVPDGWSVYGSSRTNICDWMYPMQGYAGVLNQDGTVFVEMQTSEHYTMKAENFGTTGTLVTQQAVPAQEGENWKEYATFLHYKNASDYLDYFCRTHYGSYEVIKDIELGNKFAGEYQAYVNKVADTEVNFARQYFSVNGTIQYSKVWSEGTEICRQISFTSNGKEYYAELTIPTFGYGMLMQSAYGYAYVNIMTDSWQVPFILVYMAENRELFDNNYEAYKAVADSIQLRSEFADLVRKHSEQIQLRYMQQTQIAIDASIEASREYNGSFSSTMDKVRNMWEDCIKERDEYVREDGSHFKVDTRYDSVYQSGDRYYLGTDGSAPDGWTKLNKAY